MRGLLGRTWRRAREESPRRALRAGAHEVTAGTVGRTASAVYARRRDPTPIWERDWDVCCLLDGCRFDLIRSLVDAEDPALAADVASLLEGAEVDSLWSVGSQSAEWMAHTFDDAYAQEMRRTAYVTGNPFSAQSGEQIEAVSTEPLPLTEGDFGWLYEAWRTEWVNDDISTIPPGPLTDAAIAAWRRREELGIDRVLVHYMQPHTPFRSRPDWFLGTANIDDWGQLGDDEADESETADGEDLDPADLDEETRELLEALDAKGEVGRDPWTRLRDGELPAAEFWAAYRDNLLWVLEDVARLVENCDGRVALTSDHGNGAGEFGVWSHPPAVHLPALREVPWVTLDGEDRETADPALPPAPLASDSATRESAARDAAGDAAEQRLVDLGYR
jgi:hypothetical protein